MTHNPDNHNQHTITFNSKFYSRISGYGEHLTSRGMGDEISEALAEIYNTSLSQGRLPNIWKKAQVTAKCKKGSRKEECNYRPVSLTSIYSLQDSRINHKRMHHEPPEYQPITQ